jgi:hypothetical protein
MADSYHHALSSSRRWGGEPAEYLAVHLWFDESKRITCDFRHRALRHHAEGIALCVQIFGPVITTSLGREVPTRWIAEQHVREDFGHIPSFVDWVRAIKAEPWMGRVAMKSDDLTATTLEMSVSENSAGVVPSG